MNKTKLFVFVICLFALSLFVKPLQANNDPVSIVETVSIRSKTTDTKQGLRFTAKLNKPGVEHGFYLVYGNAKLNDLQQALSKAENGKLLFNGKEIFKVPINGTKNNGEFSVSLINIPINGYFDKITVFAYVDDFIANTPKTASVVDTAILMVQSSNQNPSSQQVLNDCEDFYFKGQIDKNNNFSLTKGLLINNEFVDLNNYFIIKKDEDFVLPTPIKDGFQFLGWHDNKDLKGDPIEIISKEGYGDKMFYSNFTPYVSDEEKLRQAKDALKIIFADEDSKDSVSKDLELNVHGLHNSTITWSSSNPSVISNTGKVTRTENDVEVSLTATIRLNDKTETKVFNLFIIKTSFGPKFIFDENYEEVTLVNWNKQFNPLKGLMAIDNVDGDITNQIVVENTINNKNYGLQTVQLKVTNSLGQTATLTRDFNVIWDYDVSFIGHAGSYYGLMNSEEAILYAIQVLKYQAIEIDIKQTKDGVFILCHDDTFGGYTLANENWSTLKDVKITQSRNAGIPKSNGSVTNSPYTTGLLTLERYLEICKEHNVKCVIELKYSNGINNNDQSRMQALMDIIESKDMLNNVIFLGSQYQCLIWTRENGYDFIPCQYLVSSIESDTFYNRCVQYNFDISFNITASNSTTWIKKYQDAGLKVACYTFNQYNDYPLLQSWINKGVDYVTCDWHIMTNLVLPEKTDSPIIPDDPNEDKYIEVNWKDKNEFVTEFYTDFYNWLISEGKNLDGITVNNNAITINKNGSTATIYSVDDLKNVDVYVFEKTFGNLIYQPFNRVGVDPVYPNLNENYFLNSLKYRDKYQDLDRWFLNAIINNYTGYDKGYNFATSGQPGRVQIMFRFHQWQKGTNIPQFNVLPKKYIKI